LQKVGKMTKKHEDKSKITEEKQNEIENLENQLKRAVADYQNLEKRAQEERGIWIKTANKDLLLRILPGLDSLILADKHTKDEGVKIAIKHFLDILEEVGVRKIDTIGKDFDPKLMEAVATIEGQPGKVVEEARSGYTLYDQVLRPAQVLVGLQKEIGGEN